MRTQTLALALTGVNLVLFVALAGQLRPVKADTIPPVLRGRAVELVDERGQVRSRLNVEPQGAVVFRLFDRNGTIRVKLAAEEDGSGLMMADEATEPGVHLVARRAAASGKSATSLVLTGAGGAQRVIKP